MVAPTQPASASVEAAVEVPPRVAVPAAPSRARNCHSHTVEPGDTLLGIAMAFDVPMAAIQLQNNLGEATTVLLGEVLEIPSSQAWSGASPFWVVHEVASGETFGEIAADYGLSFGDLQAANASLDPDHIAVGEAVVLPLGVPADLLAKAVSPPAEVAPPGTPRRSRRRPGGPGRAGGQFAAVPSRTLRRIGLPQGAVEPTPEPTPTEVPASPDTGAPAPAPGSRCAAR